MKILRRILRILLVVVILAGTALFFFVQSLKPDYEGNLSLTGIEQEVRVYYDTYGIPHIDASGEEDAMRVLGYVHAQDRLWQMELLRRIAPGKLSEVFGEALVPTDKLFLSLGIDEASDKTVNQIDKNSRSVVLTEAYLDGINQFIENGPTPIEFYLTGVDKSEFSLKDVYNAIGYMAFSFAQGHKTDPLLTDILTMLGPEYLAALEVDVNPGTQWIKNYNGSADTVNKDLVVAVNQALDKLPVPSFIGSNSWVLAPSKTKNGQVILANDPHIGFAQPSVWYEAHIMSPGYEKYGYHLAGIPFPLLGHNRDVAYGLTMFENDDTDFYYEKLHPSDSNQYLTANGYMDFELITRRIRVKDAEDIEYQYKRTVHGPVLNGIAKEISGEKPVSMSWIYTKRENRLLESLFRLSHASELEEFQSSLQLLHAPGLNVMYGDARGNIAWWGAAALYQMPDSLNTKLILNGSTGREEPLRFLGFDENPQAVNPPWNYVYSANNQPDTIAGMAYPGYYLPENRAKRIVNLLESENTWNKEKVGEMVTDVTAPVNVEILKNLLLLVDEDQFTESEAHMLDKMMVWDGTNGLKSQEPSLYHRWIFYLLKNTYGDELGSERFNLLLRTHLLKRQIAPLSASETSIWWDNIHTADHKETKREIVNTSLESAFESLTADLGEDIEAWTWDKLHLLEHRHPIGQVESLRSFFNVGPFPIEGTREVINNLAFPYDSTNTFSVNSGPSTRRIIDFSDIENGWSILPTGQSGNPFSDHYEDQARMYNKGEYRKMMMNREEIVTSSKSLLIFRPE